MKIEENHSSNRIITIMDPDTEWTIRNANNCKMTGEYQTALALYNEIIQKEPKNIRALHHKANLLAMMGNHSEAVACYDSVLTFDPYNAEAWYNKGMTLKRMGDTEEGQILIQKGISLAIGNI
jgi:Flp pilus assembly protein TadD